MATTTSNLKLIELTPNMEQAYWDFHNALYPPNTPPRLHELRSSQTHSFTHAVDLLKQSRAKSNPQLGLVPHSVYWLINFDDQILGSIDFRHELSPQLAEFGGHIGYNVHPAHRRKGYATYMLKQTLPVAKTHGLTRLLITCDSNNPASIGVIKNCGGILQETATISDRPVPIMRWWIEL
ncbi:Acetyltransferase (GNAT) family protein [Poriferisphaera corsica]|uniref:Acetyltransferase (GNAT) family protein n=1 Tax=Poriferisphaera corsica TaxID=2528020 RepID=A0A517YWZ8_9BACT|nr:GNAT family N-acetyltransferase [Poriferisphaera corsica]QDU34742.1 Acetyltransferase (GNAT) family protein [Poriferisphaera corsica]